ncbi:hypothetical protein DAKH74_023620 [Maudiozyma humilis]|uniref:Uncharacterized protein n=1 Tax=Maudiozyma humilis TaxID=51915 RepID=A0AAV5RX55_MAUHU|nr:hypothetical protein DAKH74_023620 [Kazachstania humilis]
MGHTTIADVQDYMAKKEYETNGELIGEATYVQDLMVHWVRYKNNMIHGIYVDPTIDAVIVEYRGYVKMTETKYNMILGSEVFQETGCNNKNMHQAVVNYMALDANMWVENNATGTYCVMNNTKSKYLDINNAIGFVGVIEESGGTSGWASDQINKDVYYPIRFVAAYFDDGAYHQFSYHTYDNPDDTLFTPGELFYNENENYHDLDSSEKLPFPQNCPVFDNLVEEPVHTEIEHLKSYTPPKTTFPNACPATSSSISLATPEVSTSQTSSSLEISSSSEVPSTSEIMSSPVIDSAAEQTSFFTISSSEISSSTISSSAVSSSAVSSSAAYSSAAYSSAAYSSAAYSSAAYSSAAYSSAVSSSAVSSSAVSSSSEQLSSLLISSSSKQLSRSEIISSTESIPSSESVLSVTNIETSVTSSISETISSNSAVFTSEKARQVISRVHSSAELTSSKSNSLSSNDVKNVPSQTPSSLETTASSPSEYSLISSAMSSIDSSAPSVSKTSDVGVWERYNSTVVPSSVTHDLSSETTDEDQGSTDAANTRSASSTESRIPSSNTDISSTSGWNTQYSNQSAATSSTNLIVSDNNLPETLRYSTIHQGTVTQTEKCEVTHVSGTNGNYPYTPNTGKDITKPNHAVILTTQLLDTLTSAEVTTKSGPKTAMLRPNTPEQSINHKTTTTSYGVKSTAVNITPKDSGVSPGAQFHWPSEIEQSASGLVSPAISNLPMSTHIISQFADQAVSFTISTSLLFVLLLANFM